MSATTILAAFRTAVEQDPALSTGSIQWMPLGRHSIKASNRNGDPVSADVTVTADIVPALNATLQAMLAAAEKGESSKPYFDFNHDEQEASAWPTAFKWVEGKGIFADVEWSDTGKAAVAGKAYRYFSPAFFLGADENAGKPYLQPDLFCLGGLVNQPAFQRIQQVSAMAAKHAAAAGRVSTLEAELATAKGEAATLRVSLAEAAVRAARATVDAELAGNTDVPAEVRAMLAKTFITDESAARALVASLKASAKREVGHVILSPGSSEFNSAGNDITASEMGYQAYLRRIQQTAK